MIFKLLNPVFMGSLALGATSLIANGNPSSQLPLPLDCHVYSQTNSPDNFGHPLFSKMKNVQINTTYSPANVVVDGRSLNDELMYFEHNPAEVAQRTRDYMVVSANPDGFALELDNDWDTYLMSVELKKVYNDSGHYYLGQLKLSWDDVYTAQISCTEPPKEVCEFGARWSDILLGTNPNFTVVGRHDPVSETDFSPTELTAMTKIFVSSGAEVGLAEALDWSFYELRSLVTGETFLAVDENDNGIVSIFTTPAVTQIAFFDHGRIDSCHALVPNPQLAN